MEHRPKRKPTHIEDFEYLPRPPRDDYEAIFCAKTCRFLVVDADSAKDIYRGGFYGKGTESRSGPAQSETLQLSPEETFYLSSKQIGLGVLKVKVVEDSDNDERAVTVLSEEECWDLMCSLDSGFADRFTVYHKCRTTGWVLRSGLKFASDYMMYRKGPAFFHAAFAVRFSSDIPDTQTLTWRDLLSWNRVTGAVSKRQLLVHVTTQEASGGKLVRGSLEMERWVPRANRE